MAQSEATKKFLAEMEKAKQKGRDLRAGKKPKKDPPKK